MERKHNYQETQKCRICGNTGLKSILSLGEQSLTGVFPKSRSEKITTGPLELIKCMEDTRNQNCGLVQLRHSYNLHEMYSDNYGYRSSLNSSMVEHLKDVVDKAMQYIELNNDDLIIDIGSNDGTLLKFFPKNLMLVGIDPTAQKFRKYYPEHVRVVCDFFSSDLCINNFGKKKAKIITSISMFYDLENPLNFVMNVCDVMDDNGIWILEQSYMPTMSESHASDTICHEHLEYYGLKQIKWIFDRANLKIIDVELNDINGGSFKITAAKKLSTRKECGEIIKRLLANEKKYESIQPFSDFKESIKKHKERIISLIQKCNGEDKKVFGYGASTKGNVILQYCGLTEKDIPYIAEVNEDKFGAFTPQTLIPIISEKQAKAMNPDYFLVLPWHFKDNILEREKKALVSGIKFIFPLPDIEIISH